MEVLLIENTGLVPSFSRTELPGNSTENRTPDGKTRRRTMANLVSHNRSKFVVSGEGEAYDARVIGKAVHD
jgi:hypothetical protein